MTTVNILGTEYKVIREPFKDKDIDGYCDYTSREIRIRDDNVNEVGDFDELMRKQLRHEIRGRNVMLPMPKGTKVLPADQTKALMRMQNIPHFKSGIGDFFGNAWAKIKDFTGDILDYVENPRKLMQIAIDKFTDLTGVLEPGLSMAKGAVSSVFDAAVNSIKGLLSDFGGSNVKYNPSAGVEQWRKLAKKALKLTGQYSESNLNRLLMQMQSESSGNPNAINNWDSNAKAGIPSKGLMQVIDPTFRSYALAPYNKNIYDPLSNMIAAIRYTVSRYGSLSRGWNGHGYANGGFPMNGEVYVANENGFGSEYIGSIGNRHVVANNNQIVESVTISSINDDLPESEFDITLHNDNQIFNVDNPASEINFLESGQRLNVTVGYLLDSGSIEWLQMGSLYVYEWSASDEKATIKAVDVLKFLEDDYYKGQYYEKGISLYDLAELVFVDAGVGNDDYYLDTYLKKVTVYNPLPKVKHKEALQIIANAGRCVLDYDRYGRIRIHSLFQPSMETTSNGTTYYSDIKNVDIQTQKSDFATYEKNRWLADGKMLFLSKEDVQNTGYVSSAISDENGLFTENPVITRTLEAKYKAYGIYIAFSNKLPKKFIIRTYADNVLSDTLTIQSGIANDFEIQYDFPEYDKMEIEFVETEPNSRIHVDYISIGSETSYRIEYDDLYSTPVGTQLDRIKNVKVARYLYSKSSIEDELATETLVYDGKNAIYYMSDACYGYTASIEEGKSGQSANIVSSGAYYVEIAVSGVAIGETVNITVKGYKYNVSTAYTVQTVNNRGTDKEWQNPIISDAEHSKQVATWLADYFSSGIEYELDYRGEPAIDCGDTIGQENKYDSNLKTIVEESQITLNAGLLGGGLVTRRKNSVARTKN